MFELTGQAGQRLDHFLAAQLPRYSRARLQDWIKRGLVQVDGAARKPSFALRGGERIEVHPGRLAPLQAEPEAIPLDVLYEDAAIIAVNKPAGMTVHSGAGVHQGTLVNALLHRFGTLSTLSGDERPGIVHRLDRYTSGVLLVARTDQAHRHLQDQFAARTTEKTYRALVYGVVAHDSGRIERPISRSLIHRFKMSATGSTGRYAVTDYRVLRRFARHTYLDITIGTGRTHQIRVHLASLRHPVAGDAIYGGQKHESGRFFLHAFRISFDHPLTGERRSISAPLPPELEAWLQDSNL